MSHVRVAVLAAVAASLIYAIIWSVVDRGSVVRLLLTALITFVVVLLLRLFFVWLFARRRH